MEGLLKYWQLIKLTGGGSYEAVNLLEVITYLQSAFPDLLANPDKDRALCKQLAAAWQTGEAIAGLSLRCRISHSIVRECQSLVRLYGEFYHLQLDEMLTICLTDRGELISLEEFLALTHNNNKQVFKPLSYEILANYDADQSLINTWTKHFLKQHRDVKQYLKEHGILFISDWALLNDTKPRQVRRMLSQEFDWVEPAAAEAELIHEAYRSVYLIKASKGGACTDPTPEQLQAMADYIQAKTEKTYRPEQILKKLRLIAKRIRVHRIGIRPEQIPDDRPEPIAPTSNELGEDDFLSGYRQQYLSCLDQAIAQVIQTRLQQYLQPSGKAKRKPDVAQQLLQGLHLYYCEGKSQGSIAPLISLQRPEQVNRLLKLTELRSEIKLHMLPCLQNYVKTVVEASLSIERLQAISQTLEELLDQLIQEDKAEGTTNTKYTKPQTSQLSQRICRYLDSLPPPLG